MVYIYTIPLPKISIHIKSRLDNIYPSSSGIVIFFLLLFLLFIVTFMQGIYNNIIYPKETMFLGYVVLQLLWSYSFVVVVFAAAATATATVFFF
jgi:hypothetical protein